MRREQEAAGTAGRVGDDLAGPRPHAVHDGGDERTRREVLAGPALHVLRVALEQALVRVALHVSGHREPVLVPDEIDDERAELGGVLNLEPTALVGGERRGRALAF